MLDYNNYCGKNKLHEKQMLYENHHRSKLDEIFTAYNNIMLKDRLHATVECSIVRYKLHHIRITLNTSNKHD